MVIDLNADVGEGCGQDEALMRYISSANIACGGHAGDAQSMRSTVRLAAAQGVAVGAHPSFPDREHFGRRALSLPLAELRQSLIDQISQLADIAADEQVALRHVKPHGALYNAAAHDPELATCVIEAILAVDPALRLIGLAGSRLLEMAAQSGLRIIAEAFADRCYQPDGTLVPRSQADALIEDESLAVRQVMRIVTAGEVETVGGSVIQLRAETFCIHGDQPGAAAFARRLRVELEAVGVSVRAPVWGVGFSGR